MNINYNEMWRIVFVWLNSLLPIISGENENTRDIWYFFFVIIFISRFVSGQLQGNRNSWNCVYSKIFLNFQNNFVFFEISLFVRKRRHKRYTTTTTTTTKIRLRWTTTKCRNNSSLGVYAEGTMANLCDHEETKRLFYAHET